MAEKINDFRRPSGAARSGSRDLGCLFSEGLTLAGSISTLPALETELHSCGGALRRQNLGDTAHASRVGGSIAFRSLGRRQTRWPSPISAIGHQSVARLKFVRPLRGTKSIFSARGQAMASFPIDQGATESEEDGVFGRRRFPRRC